MTSTYTDSSLFGPPQESESESIISYVSDLVAAGDRSQDELRVRIAAQLSERAQLQRQQQRVAAARQLLRLQEELQSGSYNPQYSLSASDVDYFEYTMGHVLHRTACGSELSYYGYGSASSDSGGSSDSGDSDRSRHSRCSHSSDDSDQSADSDDYDDYLSDSAESQII